MSEPAAAGAPGGVPTAASTARAGAWALAADTVGQVARLGASVLVASRLGPDDFSVWALLTVVIAACVALDEGGLHQALVVRREWTRREASATFWVSSAATLVLVIGLCVLGLVLETESGSSLLPYLLVFATTLVTSTFSVVPRATLTIEMRFRESSAREVVARLLGAAVTVALAISLRSVWALLIGVVVQRVCEHLLLWSAAPAAPSPQPHLREFRPLARFAAAAIGTSLLGFASTQIGTVVTAAALDPAALGVWGLATTLFVTAQSRVAAVLSRVALPSFVRTAPERRAGAYVAALGLLTSALTPFVVLMAVLTPYLVDLALGEEWRDLTLVAALLIPAGVARGIGPLTNALFFAEDLAGLALRWELVRLPLSVVLTIAGAALWGVAGVAVASGPLLAAGVLVRLAFLRREVSIDTRAWVTAVVAPVVPSAAAAGACVLATARLGTGGIGGAVAVTVLFAAAYLAVARVVMPSTMSRWVALVPRVGRPARRDR